MSSQRLPILGLGRVAGLQARYLHKSIQAVDTYQIKTIRKSTCGIVKNRIDRAHSCFSASFSDH